MQRVRRKPIQLVASDTNLPKRSRHTELPEKRIQHIAQVSSVPVQPTGLRYFLEYRLLEEEVTQS